MSQPKVFVIERAGRPIGWLQIGDTPRVVFVDDAFSDLESDNATDQATAASKSS